MKTFEELIKRILKEKHHLTKRDAFPIDSFNHKMYNSIEILNYSTLGLKKLPKGKEKNELLKEIRKNFIINCVTAVEVYFKDLIRVTPEMSSKIRNSKQLKDLLSNKEKVNLYDAYQIFKEYDFKLGDILLYYYSFQNLQEINLVLGHLLGIDNFITNIDEFNFRLRKFEKEYFNKTNICLKNDFPEWKGILTEIFSLRHDYVHHINFHDKLGEIRVETYFKNLWAFILSTDKYYFKIIPVD